MFQRQGPIADKRIISHVWSNKTARNGFIGLMVLDGLFYFYTYVWTLPVARRSSVVGVTLWSGGSPQSNIAQGTMSPWLARITRNHTWGDPVLPSGVLAPATANAPETGSYYTWKSWLLPSGLYVLEPDEAYTPRIECVNLKLGNGTDQTTVFLQIDLEAEF